MVQRSTYTNYHGMAASLLLLTALLDKGSAAAAAAERYTSMVANSKAFPSGSLGMMDYSLDCLVQQGTRPSGGVILPDSCLRSSRASEQISTQWLNGRAEAYTGCISG